MKRKTNLFYTSGNDSNFITFSNYTENLTGSYLSTNTKLYPTNFLCLDLKCLKDKGENYILEKKNFIKYLCCRYENKLASLRDKCQELNLKCEDYLYPLDYLLQSIYEYEESELKITYIGNVIEYDYNGVYSDIICTINGAYVTNNFYSISETTQQETPVVFEGNDLDMLYNWAQDIPEEYGEYKPIYDGESNYYISQPRWELLLFNVSDNEDLSFNIIIPLYNVINVNDEANFNTDILNESVLNIGNYNTLVPLGIWFSGVNNVDLLYDDITHTRVNWSLTLASQFKPFPYSHKLITDGESSNNAGAYTTFAEILKNYDKITKAILDMNSSITNINNRLVKVELILRNYNLYGDDSISQEILDRLNSMLKQIDNINASITPITWVEK